MAGIVKKKPVDTSSPSTGLSNNPKHLVAPRQRGIPTRVYKDGDRQLDANRNLRPTSRIQLSSSESLENKDHNSNAKLDNADAKTGSVSQRSLGNLSSPKASARKTNSAKLIADCDNRSQVISSRSTSVSDQDVDKPVNRVRASRLSTYNPTKLRPVAKPNVEQPSLVPTTQVAESNHNSFKSPKRFAGNRNYFNKIRSKVSSSDEACALKSTEELPCLNGASGKEISVSADHIAVRNDHCNAAAVGLLNANEVFASDSSVISEPAVTGSCLKEISPEKANERSLERAAETKRLVRGRPGTENLGNRSNLRPQSSGGLATLRKNQKFRQSTSTERPASSMPRSTNSQPASDSAAVNSSEMEQESSKRRKGSGGSGTKVSASKEMSGKVDGSNGSKFHAVARNQNTAVALVAGGKPDKGLKNHVNMTVSGLYRNAAVPSRKAEVRGRDNASAKLSLVPKILVSHEPQDLETVPLSSQKASSDVQQKNEVIVCKSSSVSCSTAEVPSVNDMHPSDNRQCQQPVAQTVNGDTTEDSNRRLFRNRPSRAAADADDDVHPKLGRYVEMEDVQSTDSWNSHRVDADGKTPPASESENVVVMDVETFEQMKDEFQALKATVLQLQRVLIENDAVESQIGDNGSWQSAVKSHCYDGGDEATPTDGQIQLANVCQVLQENIRLQGKVDELEKLLQEQERVISILRHKSAPFHIRMLPGVESATSETDVESQLKNSCCATEHNVEVPASSPSSRLTRSADEPQSSLHLSTTAASPPSSPQRTRFLHTTAVHNSAEKSKKCHTPTSSKAFGSNEREMRCSSNDVEASSFSLDHNKPVVHSLQDEGRDIASTDFTDSSQTVETSPSRRLRRATLGGCEEEEFSGEYSMFDYNFSVDSDSELGPGICDAPESISLGVTDAGQGGAPFVGVEHCVPDRRLMNEENGIRGFIATSDSRLGRGDVAIIQADASDNYDVPSSAQTDQNFNGRLNENGICDNIGKFAESFSSNSLVSPVHAEEERTVCKMLDSVESSNQRVCEETDDSVFNSPVRFERRAAELWSRYDQMPEKALIKQPPKCETSSIPSFPCNSVSGEIKSLKPVQTSQSSNVTQFNKIPNPSRTLLRIPKCNVGVNHEVEEFTSGSSVTSPPPSGVCSTSQPVHVVPEVASLNQRQLKEPTSSSRLPSLRLPRVSKLPTSVAK